MESLTPHLHLEKYHSRNASGQSIKISNTSIADATYRAYEHIIEGKNDILKKCNKATEGPNNSSKSQLTRHLSFTITVKSRPVNKLHISNDFGDVSTGKYMLRKNQHAKGRSPSAIEGSPFGVSSERFKMAGTHPRMRSHAEPDEADGSKVSKFPAIQSVRESSQTSQYDIFKLPVAKNYYKMTALTTKQMIQKIKEKSQKSLLGPGSYDIPDFLEEIDKRPTGIIRPGPGFQVSPRFLDDERATNCVHGKLHREEVANLVTVPGPGTHKDNYWNIYGKRSFYRGKQLLSTGKGHQPPPEACSHLPPNTYNVRGCIDEFLSKPTGEMGPYYAFASSTKATTGCQVKKKSADPGPGTYDPHQTSLFDPHHSYRVPSKEELLMIKNKSSKPNFPSMYIVNDAPGPGAYNIEGSERPPGPPKRSKAAQVEKREGISSVATYKAKLWKSPLGFLSTTKRTDKLTALAYNQSTSLTGPGHYKICRSAEVKGKGHKHLFRSRTERMPPYRVSDIIKQQKRQLRISDMKNARLDKFKMENKALFPVKQLKSSHIV